MRPLLMVFVKFPTPGRVKTRIAESLGAEEAARIYRELVARVAAQVVPSEAEDPGWAIWIVFDPPEAESSVRGWLEPPFGGAIAHYEPQIPGGLGERLAAAFRAGFAAGFDRVAAIGTDCVDLTAQGIRQGWCTLDESDVVFGPADDGGYYLVGLKQECPALFEGVPWSSAQTLAASRAKAERLGLRIGELETLTDVDQVEQWEALCARDADRS